jgi:hypothetical protein
VSTRDVAGLTAAARLHPPPPLHQRLSSLRSVMHRTGDSASVVRKNPTVRSVRELIAMTRGGVAEFWQSAGRKRPARGRFRVSPRGARFSHLPRMPLAPPHGQRRVPRVRVAASPPGGRVREAVPHIMCTPPPPVHSPPRPAEDARHAACGGRRAGMRGLQAAPHRVAAAGEPRHGAHAWRCVLGSEPPQGCAAGDPPPPLSLRTSVQVWASSTAAPSAA